MQDYRRFVSLTMIRICHNWQNNVGGGGGGGGYDVFDQKISYDKFMTNI